MNNWNWDDIEFLPDDLAESMANFYNYCSDEYRATSEGCQANLDLWESKANRFDKLFENTPGYVKGEHCIVLDSMWLRTTNKKKISKFYNNLNIDCRELNRVEGKTKNDWYNVKDILNSYLYHTQALPTYALDYHGVQKIKNDYNHARKVYSSMSDFTPESGERYSKRRKLVLEMCDYTEQFLNEYIVDQIKEIYPELKPTVGQKTSRFVRKWCKVEEFENEPNFKAKYAEFSDAINPLEVPELLVFSWHPFDYLTMSFGRSWTSCHTPDKENIHDYVGRTAGYRGCCSSGVLSLMDDNATIVAYSVPKGTVAPYWKPLKNRRQLFHLRLDGKAFVQGRIYPDDQRDNDENGGIDSDYGIYKPWREIFQSIVATAYGFPNLWSNKRGVSACSYRTISKGTHYCDYTSYPNCNVSFTSDAFASSSSISENEKIVIGHYPMCVDCGNEHRESEWATCDSCRDGGRFAYCADCGERIDLDNDDYATDGNGNYYCYDCSTYCEYHEEREPNRTTDFIYVRGYGDVCQYGLESLLDEGYAYRCEECDEYYYEDRDHDYEDSDGETHHFCSDECLGRYVSNH